MHLSDRFVNNSIIIDSCSADKESILNEMVNTLCSANQLKNKDVILNAVLEREKSRSTGIGCGLAIPHAKVDCVDRMCIAAATVKKGIAFDSLDGEDVNLLILIVSPENTVGPHLKALSTVSRLLADGAVRQDLIDSKTPEEFLTVLKKAEDKYL